MNRRRYIAAIVLCVYIAAVAVLCFIRQDNAPSVNFTFLGIASDKIAHFLMFLPFTPIAYAAFRPDSRRIMPHLLVLLAVMMAGAGLAAGTERIQAALEYRSGDIIDFAADMAGMAAGCIFTVIHIIRTYRK